MLLFRLRLLCGFLGGFLGGCVVGFGFGLLRGGFLRGLLLGFALDEYCAVGDDLDGFSGEHVSYNFV